jgi:hypothetical protein
MFRRIIHVLLYALALNCLILLVVAPFTTKALAADKKPELSLNLQQGPLGVTLTLSGKNFPAGDVSFSYIDAQNVPGVFVTPSDTGMQVDANGTFASNNLILPASGPAGDWKIVVKDSSGAIWTTGYKALAAPGQPSASSPTLTLNPTSATSGDLITFTGSNWLPKGTTVNLLLQINGNSIPLLEPSPTSDESGTISGTFHLPTNLNVPQANILATDASTGALRAQQPITILNGSPTPTSSPTAGITPSPTSTTTSLASSTDLQKPNTPANNSGNSISTTDRILWGAVLLVVAAIIAVAAFMLVLFMLPWSERKTHSPGGHH